ncbi:hypothetical protein C6W96_09850 [Streptomyces sp. CS149]|nr:hypothetical protein C6W96_09850 [Streptomyces sp. CS149]PWS45800.1 hypothetical protein DLE01_37100 [Streptomyces sp. FT05W]
MHLGGATDAPALWFVGFLRNDAHHVIVPSLEQLTEHQIIGGLLEAAIEREAGAVLHQASALSGPVSGI